MKMWGDGKGDGLQEKESEVCEDLKRLRRNRLT
jgi:hypothetical protein